MTKYDWMGEVINNELWKRLKFDPGDKWYRHKSVSKPLDSLRL